MLNYSNLLEGVFERKDTETLRIQSIYNFEKITTLFKNFDTMSFLDLILNYKELINNGYNQTFLNQSLHSLLSLPFSIIDDCNSINTNNE